MTAHTVKKTDLWLLNPSDCLIAGVDYGDSQHPLYDPRCKLPLDPAMVDSISAEGVIEPIIVRKEGEAFFVIDGRRRVLHARAAIERVPELRVPCRSVRATDKAAYGVLIAANELRLDDTMLARSAKAKRYMEEHGATVEETAQAFGITRQMVQTLLDLQNLDAQQLKKLAELDVSETAMARIGRLSAELRGEAIERVAERTQKKGKRLSTREVEDEARAAGTPRLQSRGRKLKALEAALAYAEGNEEADSAYWRAAADALRWALGDDEAQLDLTEAAKGNP